MTLTRTARLRVFAIAWLLFSLLGIAFAVANPIGASPDEPSHLVKAASVVRGDLFGVATPEGNAVVVPQYVAHSHQVCFAFHPDVTADCVEPVPEPSGAPVTSLTQSGFYNPVYYALVGWPSLVFDDSRGIYGMRIVSALLTASFLALTVTVISTWPRPLLPLLGVAVATTPMVLFLAGSVNPNALETAGTLAAFAGLWSLVRNPDPVLRAERVAVIVVAAALSANTRAVAPAWIVLAVVIALLAAGSWQRVGTILKERVVMVGAALGVAALLIAATWTIVANRIDATDGVDDYREFPGVGTNPIVGFLQTLLRTVDFGAGAVGIFGWLDTPLPHTVYFIWAVLVGGLAVVAFLALHGRGMLVAAALVGAFVLMPAILQGLWVTSGGYIWQGRYALPLLAIAILGLAALLAEELPDVSATLGRRLVVTVLLAWVIGHGYAFVVNLKRYAAGADGAWGALLNPAAWNPPGGSILWIVTFGVVLVIFAIALGGWALRRYGTSTMSKSAVQTASSDA